MAENNYIVVGKKHVVTGKGNDFFTYYFQRPFTLYESENSKSCAGMAVEVENSFTDFPCKPDDVVRLVYTKGFGDKAVLSDIQIVKPHVK